MIPVSDETNEKTGDSELKEALESTLEGLNQSIVRMETIVQKLADGEADWEETLRLMSEANDLAIESSQKLDRVVQNVVYGSGEEEAGNQDQIPGLD